MRKLSRCWLGAVPRYWNVVASCLSSESRYFSTDSLTLFLVFMLLNLSTKDCLRFFYSVSKFSGVQKKTGLTFARYFGTFPNI